ncbi:ATP-dependent zinc metalloprotease FtsH [Anaerofilum hominis]|nr:ATP-dependent zinc metalloprotease FtsH [Anaerofilum hominis]
MSKKPNRSTASFVILLALAAVLVFLIFRMPTSTMNMKYSQVLGYFKEQKVKSFTFDPNDGTLTLVMSAEDAAAALKETQKLNGVTQVVAIGGFGSQQAQATPAPTTGPDGQAQAAPKDQELTYTVAYANLFLNQVMPYIDEYDQAHPDAPMVYDILPVQSTPMWLSFLPTIIMVVALGALFWMMMRQSGGGGGVMNVGKVKAKDQASEGRKATFADVAGADEEKAELQEIVEFLKSPAKFNALGARIPRGVLLVGPPGTGKTLIARACAGEAGVPFYSISGSDFVEMYVGVGASRVRDLFEKAKKSAPCIVFIDEIDAVGRQRGAGLGGGHDEREQTLNQLLVEMDGFTANDGVIVIAATNRADILDKALLRPGRFDRQIYVGLPDVRGREQILKVHTRNKPMAPDINLATIAKSTPGFTGADLENLVNEAALLAARRGKKAITQAEIEEASIKVIAGPEKKSRVITPKERRLTAYHEGGHAIATYYSKTGDPVHQITIVPRGAAGGFTMSLPEEDTNYTTKSQMEDEIVILLGGRVAEKLVLDDISTGASNDLERATAIARAMVTRYGFSDRLGPVVYGSDPSETFLGRDFSQGRGFSETVAAEIDSEMRELIDDAYDQCAGILTEHMDQLHKVAAALLERETLSGEEFKAIMEGRELPPKEEQDKKTSAAPASDAQTQAGGENGAKAVEEIPMPSPVQPDEAEPDDSQP